jgi:membrane protein involved in D-alanine export
MVPYADFTYFLWLALYIALPTLLLRAIVGFSRYWVVLVTLFGLAVQYSRVVGPPSQQAVGEFAFLGGYLLYQWLIAVAFLKTPMRKRSRWPSYLVLALTVLPLALAKFQVEPGLAFLGISYVTFRNLDVIFGINDGLVLSLHPAQFFAYTLFLPTISSGPIDRYRRFTADWHSEPERRAFYLDMDQAIHRIFTGFLYKFIIAAVIDRYWLQRIDYAGGMGPVLAYMYGYSLYLFFDFAGYSAFAIGVSYVLGIHTPENFARPFAASNIRDFWNRWHISLSTWLRDHVYMRFVMAATRGRWFKGRYTASYLGFFLAFGLMGLWHGLQWYYIAYGLYHAALLSGYDVFSRWNRSHKIWGDGLAWRLAGILVTFHFVCFGFLLFSGRLGPLVLGDRWPAEVFQGMHDASDCETIRGWARNTAEPASAVELEIREGDVVLGKVVADKWRPDLARIFNGDGAHGFEYAVPDTLKDGQLHTLEVKIAAANVVLRGTPQRITCIKPLQTMEGYDGYLEDVNCQRISGWAWHPARPEVAVQVDVYDRDTLLGSVLADGMRPDLLREGTGTGRYGFVYSVPSTLRDGEFHVIRVKFGGTDIDLSASPRLLRCDKQ